MSDSAVDGKGTSVTAVADLPPNRVERYVFLIAHVGERVPNSSERASRPGPVLRCALRSRKCAMLRGDLLARRHPAWLVWCLACSRVHRVVDRSFARRRCGWTDAGVPALATQATAAAVGGAAADAAAVVDCRRRCHAPSATVCNCRYTAALSPHHSPLLPTLTLPAMPEL